MSKKAGCPPGWRKFDGGCVRRWEYPLAVVEDAAMKAGWISVHSMYRQGEATIHMLPKRAKPGDDEYDVLMLTLSPVDVGEAETYLEVLNELRVTDFEGRNMSVIVLPKSEAWTYHKHSKEV